MSLTQFLLLFLMQDVWNIQWYRDMFFSYSRLENLELYIFPFYLDVFLSVARMDFFSTYPYAPSIL